jgi:hypothetical protein
MLPLTEIPSLRATLVALDEAAKKDMEGTRS